MTTETHTEMSPDTTLSGPAEHTSAPKRKRHARRKNTQTQPAATTATETCKTTCYNVPVGESGEVVESAWHFGG